MAENADRVLLTVMVLMTLADGRVVEDEVTRMRWIYSQLTDDAISEDDVRTAIASVKAEELGIEDYLASVLEQLDVEARRRALKAAFAIASADGRVLDEEDEMLVRIAKGLEIAPADYRAVLSHLKVAREFG